MIEASTIGLVLARNVTLGQRSFRKTGTVGTLASKAEIAPRTLLWGPGLSSPGKKLRLYMKNLAMYCILT